MEIVNKLKKTNSYQVYYINSKNQNCMSPCFSFIANRDYYGINENLIIDLNKFSEIIDLKHVNKIIELINKITICELTKENKIYYKIIDFEKPYYYNKNLVLLNFLRLIWYNPYEFMYNDEEFFNNLYIEHEDPMYILTTANQKACDKYIKSYNISHSNGCFKPNVKTLKDFNNFKFTEDASKYETIEFIQSK